MITFGIGRNTFAFGLGDPYGALGPQQPTVTAAVLPVMQALIEPLVIETAADQTRRRIYDKTKKTL